MCILDEKMACNFTNICQMSFPAVLFIKNYTSKNSFVVAISPFELVIPSDIEHIEKSTPLDLHNPARHVCPISMLLISCIHLKKASCS